MELKKITIERDAKLKNYMFLPVEVGSGHSSMAGHYLFDTGSVESYMSEGEARRLGITVQRVFATAEGPQGASLNIVGVAVLPEMTIGGVVFKNAVFNITSGNTFPFNELLPGKQALLGMNVAFGLRSFSWSPKSDTFTSPNRPQFPNTHREKLAFNLGFLIGRVSYLSRPVDLVLDTAYGLTSFNGAFLQQFPSTKRLADATCTFQAMGVIQAKIKSVVLTDLRFKIADTQLLLPKASLFYDGSPLLGKLGIDVLSQPDTVSIDLDAMAISLQGSKTSR